MTKTMHPYDDFSRVEWIARVDQFISELVGTATKRYVDTNNRYSENARKRNNIVGGGTKIVWDIEISYDGQSLSEMDEVVDIAPRWCRTKRDAERMWPIAREHFHTMLIEERLNINPPSALLILVMS